MQKQKMDIDERFWSKVKLENEIFPENGCMLWTGPLRPNGYGQFTVNCLPKAAHRWIYERLRGPIPDGMEMHHLCGIRHCVNPDHLEPVTRKQNVRLGKVMLPRTHCKQGHLLSANNVYVRAGGVRICKICNRARNQKYHAQKRGYMGDQNAAIRVRREVTPDWIKIRNRKGINSPRANWSSCVNGHEFTKVNTGWHPNGTRYCRMCKRIRVRRYRDAIKRRQKSENDQ